MTDIENALSVPCPGCKMGADQKCVDLDTGATVDGVHQNRIYRYYVVTTANAENEAIQLRNQLGALFADGYLVWSNQKSMWSRANHAGYTSIIDEAGRYTRAEADAIVKNATCEWQLKHTRTDPVSGVEYVCFDEVVVAAPEAIELPW